MAAPIVQIRYDELEDIAKRFQLLAEVNEQVVATIRTGMEQLHRAGWVGRGADAFIDEMTDEIMPAMARLTNALEMSSTTTLHIIQIMQDAESEAAQNYSVGTTGDLGLPLGMGVGAAITGVSIGQEGARSGGVREPTIMRGIPGFSGSRSWGSRPDDDLGDFSVILYEGQLFNYYDSLMGGQLDGRYGTLRGDILGYEAHGQYSVGFDSDGLEVDFDLGADAYLVQGEYNGRFGPIGLGVEGQVGAGVDAQAQLEINPFAGDLELEAEVGAFAGVSVEGEATADMGPVGVGVTGEIGYGVGAEGHIDVGLDDWKLGFKIGASAYLGLGGGVGYETKVDLKEIFHWGAQAL